MTDPQSERVCRQILTLSPEYNFEAVYDGSVFP